MSARRWPTGSSGDVKTTTTAEPAVLAPPPVLGEMTLEEVTEETRKREDALRLARSERDDATAALATAKATLPEAASRGFEAAREAQRAISEAEERLRAAQVVTDAMEAAHRPFAEERWRLAKARNREVAGAALAAKIRERAAVDAEMVAALEALAPLAARRDTLTAEALGIIESVERDGSGPVGNIERTYYGSPVVEAVRRLPITLLRTIPS